jgi:hypothetical protein
MLESFGLWPGGGALGGGVVGSGGTRQLPTLDDEGGSDAAAVGFWPPASAPASDPSKAVRARRRVSGHAGLEQLRTSKVRFSIDEESGGDHRGYGDGSGGGRGEDGEDGSEDGSDGGEDAAAVAVLASGGRRGGGGTSGRAEETNEAGGHAHGAPQAPPSIAATAPA